MTLEVKVEQDPVVFHGVIFKSTDSSSNIRRIIFGVRKKKLIKRVRELFQIYENHICELWVKNWIWKRSS